MRYVSEGKTVTYSNGTGSDIAAGDPVPMGDSIGVALVDIPNGEEGSVSRWGRHKQAPKVSGTAWNQGDSLDWDASAGAFTKDIATPASGDIEDCASAAEDAASTAVEAEVILENPGTLTP